MNTEADGADYLRRLKKDLGVQNDGAPPAAGPSMAVVERRAVPRYKCAGGAQVREEKSEVSTWASITDISMHGCYVEMSSAFPVGTIVFLQIEVENKYLLLKGEVRVTYPFLGMGVAFRDLDVGNRAQLAEVVHTVASKTHVAVQAPNTPEAVPIMPDVPDAQRALDSLRGFFLRHRIMTRDEFAGILHSLAKPQ